MTDTPRTLAEDLPGLEAQVRRFLLDYAWLGRAEDRAAEVDCIMAQGGWRHVDAFADKYAGAQWEAGPQAFIEGIGYALSALYECHIGPHLDTCPRKKGYEA